MFLVKVACNFCRQTWLDIGVFLRLKRGWLNDNQVLSTNTGITIVEGDSEAINNTELEVTDVDNTAAELVYTLTLVPINGLLKLDGVTLSVDDTFTQADIYYK